MPRTFFLLALVLAVSAPALAESGPSAPAADAVPASAALAAVRPARELAVMLVRFAGLPSDSASREALLVSFRAEMDRHVLATEKREGDHWAAADSQVSAFRLVELASADEAWTLDVSVRVPPEARAERRGQVPPGQPPMRARVGRVRSSRGLVVAVTARRPVRDGRPVEVEPVKHSVYFPDARRVVAPAANLPGGGYAYPWDDAGRVVARAALEALHRVNGQLGAHQRADLSPATRVEGEP
jgi:hypothetical protein